MYIFACQNKGNRWLLLRKSLALKMYKTLLIILLKFEEIFYQNLRLMIISTSFLNFIRHPEYFNSKITFHFTYYCCSVFVFVYKYKLLFIIILYINIVYIFSAILYKTSIYVSVFLLSIVQLISFQFWNQFLFFKVDPLDVHLLTDKKRVSSIRFVNLNNNAIALHFL